MLATFRFPLTLERAVCRASHDGDEFFRKNHVPVHRSDMIKRYWQPVLVELAVDLNAGFFSPDISHAQKFVHAYSSISALNAPFWIIQDAGFAKQEGLETELVYIPSSSTVAQATLAGEVMISPANGQVIADVGLQGGDLIAMGGITNVVAFYIMAAPEIKTITDLKGKSVGVTRFGASGDVGIRMFLVKYGLEPVKDVPLIQLGGLPEIAAALSKKTIYAAALVPTDGVLSRSKAVRVFSRTWRRKIFPSCMLVLRPRGKFVRERRAQAKAYLRAYARAVHFMHTRKEETKAIFTRYTKIKDQGMLDGSIVYGYDFIEKVPLVKPAGFQVTSGRYR